MKRLIALSTAGLLCASVAQAQEADGPSLMERGAQMFLEGILKEMEPAIDELSDLKEEMGPALRQFADEMGPRLQGLLAEIEDWSVYEAPEVLPNGDIIIRRKPDAPKIAEDAAPQIDL